VMKKCPTSQLNVNSDFWTHPKELLNCSLVIKHEKFDCV
jgi:hypothetical protein